jgi:1,4-dihydroxy-2-naphthoate octaprenyltransferase
LTSRIENARWRIWVAACRPRTLPAAVAPVLVGSAMAAHNGRFDGAAAAICLCFALLIQIGTNFANDYYDFMNGADTRARVGPRRAVASGMVAPDTMRRAMAATFAVAFLIGLALIAWGGIWMLAVGLISIACGIAYTGGPWPLGYHGLGDLFVFIFFGLVGVCATYYVQAGRIPVETLLGAVPVGLLAANILVVNNYRDAETDAAAGKRTTVVRFGRRAARLQFDASLIAALAAPFAFLARGYGAFCLLPLVLIPAALKQHRRLIVAASPGELIALLGDTGKFLAAYALCLAAGLVV